MQVLPIRQINLNNSKKNQSPSFQALRPHFHRTLNGRVGEVSSLMDHRIRLNSEVIKAIKYLETKGKDLAYNVEINQRENIYNINFNTINPSESLYSTGVAKEYFSNKYELNCDTNELNFKADDFIKGYENFVKNSKNL